MISLHVDAIWGPIPGRSLRCFHWVNRSSHNSVMSHFRDLAVDNVNFEKQPKNKWLSDCVLPSQLCAIEWLPQCSHRGDAQSESAMSCKQLATRLPTASALYGKTVQAGRTGYTAAPGKRRIARADPRLPYPVDRWNRSSLPYMDKLPSVECLGK